MALEGWKEIRKYYLGFFGKENQDNVSRELGCQQAGCQDEWEVKSTFSSDLMGIGHQRKRGDYIAPFFSPLCK